MIRPTTIILAAILLLGPLLVAELGVRALIDTGRLPSAPSSSDFADVSLANARRLGQPNVLLVGASTVRNALKPATLERLIEDETGLEVHVQSVAQGGVSMATQLLLVRALAEDGLLPQTVIIGVSPVSLVGGFPPEGDWLARSELGRQWSGCTSDGLAPQSLDCALGRVSALWRWRGRAEQVTQALGAGMPTTFTDRGRTLKPDGWVATRPSTGERLIEQLPRALERMDEDVVVPSDVVEGFAQLVEYLREQDVDVVALRMPYWSQLETALVERNPEWTAQRDAGYEQLSAAADIELLDADAFEAVAEVRWFRDPRHLSRLGAGPYTRSLWADPDFRGPILESLASAD